MSDPALATETDRRFLSASVRLGASRRGMTWPNPSVGCLIVKDGIVISQGITGDGGRPHGERLALDRAGEAARGATAYVSLEPCNHYGKTPPCTEALIAFAIERVVIALGDPDPRVSGSGVARLQEAGVNVLHEPFADLKARAKHAHRGHISRVANGRPHVTLKLALSADGGIGLPGEGQIAITSPATNRLMHGLRARMDAIAVGAGTFAADAPQLTVRLPGLQSRSPERVVFGGPPPDGLIHLPGHDLASGLNALGQKGLTSLLVEGGAKLARSLIKAGLVDEIILIKGARTLGAGAIKPFDANPFTEGVPGFAVQSKRQSEPDTIVTFTADGKA